jgi:predicted transposase YbfD/YdcC
MAVVSHTSVVERFESLPDPQDVRNRRPLLVGLIIIAVCGVIVGCEGPTTVHRWAKLPDDFPLKQTWPSIEAIGMATRITEYQNGKPSDGTRYYITSRHMSGKKFGAAVRDHWRIENSPHWVLDVTFDEDQSRAQARRLADNFTWLRSLAIGRLKQHASKHGIKGKRQITSWSNDDLTDSSCHHSHLMGARLVVVAEWAVRSSKWDIPM